MPKFDELQEMPCVKALLDDDESRAVVTLEKWEAVCEQALPEAIASHKQALLERANRLLLEFRTSEKSKDVEGVDSRSGVPSEEEASSSSASQTVPFYQRAYSFFCCRVCEAYRFSAGAKVKPFPSILDKRRHSWLFCRQSVVAESMVVADHAVRAAERVLIDMGRSTDSTTMKEMDNLGWCFTCLRCSEGHRKQMKWAELVSGWPRYICLDHC